MAELVSVGHSIALIYTQGSGFQSRPFRKVFLVLQMPGLCGKVSFHCRVELHARILFVLQMHATLIFGTSYDQSQNFRRVAMQNK